MAAEHRCDTGNFDRTICPEPCGMMHSYCGTCGERQDTCAHDQHPMTLTTKDAEALAEALRKCRVEDGSPAPLFHEGDLMHIAHVLIASGAVRPAAEVRAEAWDEGYTSGFSNAMRRMSDEPDAPTTPNPYRAALAEEGDRCDNRGPRLGNEGYPRCRLLKDHAGLHKCAPVDGWGDVQW